MTGKVQFPIPMRQSASPRSNIRALAECIGLAPQSEKASSLTNVMQVAISNISYNLRKEYEWLLKPRYK